MTDPAHLHATDSPVAADAPDAPDGPDSVVTTSFGAFKPVGHVMVGVPTAALADALAAALDAAGWRGPALRQFSPRESVAQWQSLVDNAGPLAGFGFEITLLRRYLELTEAGYCWLLVQADDDGRAVAAADIARAGGATLAVHYRSLTVEELIP